MSEFFGFGGYQRTPEGYLSWQHLLFVSSLMLLMIASAVFLGLRNKNRDEKAKNLPLIVAAIAIDSFEIFKIVMLCFRNENPMDWVRNLPLFLCSIQLISIPLAAFTKGKLREVCLDFIFVFGLLGAVAGTYGAGQNYGAYPVLSLDNVVSGITHSISGFCSLYIAITGLTGLEWKNLPYCCGIMAAFCVLAYIADILIPYNYMFLMRGDGTPYDIFYNMVNGNQVLYPIIVVLLFFLYIGVFYGVYHLAKKPFAKKEREEEAA